MTGRPVWQNCWSKHWPIQDREDGFGMSVNESHNE